jgi:hypothetical protein
MKLRLSLTSSIIFYQAKLFFRGWSKSLKTILLGSVVKYYLRTHLPIIFKEAFSSASMYLRSTNLGEKLELFGKLWVKFVRSSKSFFIR